MFSFRFWWLCNSKHTEGVPMAQLFATGIYTTLWTLPRRADNDSQTRDPHETKSHERTEFLVTRNQGKHPDRGCAKASHDDRISGRGELDRASQKNVRKTLDVIHARPPDKETGYSMEKSTVDKQEGRKPARTSAPKGDPNPRPFPRVPEAPHLSSPR